MKTFRLLMALCLICLFLTVSACGKKGPPRVPEQEAGHWVIAL